MTQDAALQLRRLLQLIPRLADGKPHAIDAVAKLAGADRDTVLGDLYSLAERFGDPGGFVPGLQVFIEATGNQVRMLANHFARPMRLTAPELCALDLGLAMIRAERPPSEHAAIERARERLRRALTKLPQSDIGLGARYAELGADVDATVLVTLRRGVRERKKVRIAYRASQGKVAQERVVSPYGLVASRGAWYVVGHSDERDAVRIFRVDRIDEAKLLADSFTVPDSFSLDGIIQNGRVFRSEEARTLRVRYSPRIARWIAEREGVPLEADGSLVIDHPLADARWAVRHVLQYGPDVEVLEPESVRRDVAAALKRILHG